MVTRPRRVRILPKHAPALAWGDYWTYLSSVSGPHLDQGEPLERVWRPLIGSLRIAPTPTGRHALWAFLEAADLRAGDEVLVSAYNFYIIVRLLIQRGLVPVFVDIEPDTLCMDPDDLARKLTPRSRMVLVTHLFGHPADLDRIRRICQERNLLLFEDCAHAVGTRCGADHAGSRSDGALFSFGIYKLVTAFGGGMLATRDAAAARVRFEPPHRALRGPASWCDTDIRAAIAALLHPRWYGWLLHPALQMAKRRAPQLYHLVEPSGDDPAYRFEVGNRAPFKPYMTRLLERQLGRLEEQITRRREIIRSIAARVADCEGIRPLDGDRYGRSNGAYFGLYVFDPEAAAASLEAQGIVADPHEYYDCSALPQFAAHRARCPRAQYAQAHLLRVPNFPSLTEADVDRIAAALRAACTAPVPAAPGPASSPAPSDAALQRSLA